MNTKLKNDTANELIIVSGLPRSGTSMMMKMLAAGGIEPVTDSRRTADEDNLLGYFEDERVRQLAEDNSWITADLAGRALKVISMLLYHLPVKLNYSVLFMQRDIDEVLASQRKMLERRGETDTGPPDEVMAAKFGEHLEKVAGWLAKQENFRTLYVSYADAVARPGEYASRVAEFLGRELDQKATAGAVEPAMYRNRSA
jgi:hypothetical protein